MVGIPGTVGNKLRQVSEHYQPSGSPVCGDGSHFGVPANLFLTRVVFVFHLPVPMVLAGIKLLDLQACFAIMRAPVRLPVKPKGSSLTLLHRTASGGLNHKEM